MKETVLNQWLLAAVLGIGGTTFAACAEDQFFYSTNPPNPAPTIIEGPSEEPGAAFDERDIRILMDVTASTQSVTIRPSRPNQRIGRISVKVFNSGTTLTNAGIVAVDSTEFAVGKSVQNIYNISMESGSKPLIVQLVDVGQLGTLTRPVNIQCNGLSVIRIRESSQATGYTGDVFGTINVDAVPGRNGDAEELIDVRGNFLGTLSIDGVLAGGLNVGGNFGSSATLASLSAKRVRSIIADSIFANISTTSTDATDWIARVSTRSGGDFVGSLTTTLIRPWLAAGENDAFIDIARDLDANITVRDDVVRESGTLANPSRTIRVGRDFKAGRTISIGGTLQGPNSSGQWLGGISIGGTEGLKGQVIINADNTTGQWQGGISIPVIDPLGSTVTETLGAASAYAIPNAKLGNGSVGLVPYQLHGPSSSPPNGQLGDPTSVNDLTNTDIMAGQSIALEFYGPVQLPTSGAPVKVVVTGLCSGDNPDVTQSFSYIVSGRRLLITKNPNALFPYNYVPSGNFRVTNLPTGGLLCQSLGVPVAAFSYEFRLHTDCNNDGSPLRPNGQPEGVCGSTGFCDSIDFNRNSVYPEEQDVTDFLNVLAGGPCPYGGTCDIDFNNNGAFPEDKDYQDFLDVIAGDCMTCYPD